ncbi:MAG: 4-(cytidine 5'-diphospho)-2-C-methyl-D-erythritol kinase, partial [Victivallaceae bacterium]
MQKLILNTPSKINLLLKVTGRRADGYHELNTLFVPLKTPSDTITLEFSLDNGVSVDCSDESVPSGKDNICAQAANAYAEKTGISPGWKIHIDKHIPVAAGMGGGSSDAAAVLNLLNNHYRKLSPSELAKLAVAIGADVPF